MTDFKKGDRVRVTLEGVVTPVDDDIYDLAVNGRYGVMTLRQSYSKVEVLPPPVEVFGPGTTVRGKVSGHLYSISKAGFFDHSTGHYVEYAARFTSQGYERVELK